MSFYEKIKKINEILDKQGKAVVQVKKIEKNGQVKGPVQYGYNPQAVFDAVNEVIGPENWRYQFVDGPPNVTDRQAIAFLEVFFKVGDEWVSKGPQYGQSNIIFDNVGDALKGSITDAIQKCMSLWGIGSKAYRGELKEVYEKGRKPQQDPKPKAHGNGNGNSLPRITGITYKREGNLIIAQGDTYNKSRLLEAAGFTLENKRWVKPISVQ